MYQRMVLLLVLLAGVLLGGNSPVLAQVLITKETREITPTVTDSEYFQWVFGGISIRYTGMVWAPKDIMLEAEFLTLIEYEDRTVMVVFSSEIKRWFGLGRYKYIIITGPSFVHVSKPDKGRVRGNVHRVKEPEKVRDYFKKQGAVVIERGVQVIFATDTGGHGKITQAQHYRIQSPRARLSVLGLLSRGKQMDRSNAIEVNQTLWTSSEEARVLSDGALKSDYFDHVFWRLENQHNELVWMPSDRLNAATFLTLVEYEDTAVFVCFSPRAALYEKDSRMYAEIAGPAVIYPVLSGNGEAKFKNNRYVGFKGTKADWSKRDRHFFDEYVRAKFEDGTGGHGKIVLTQMFRIRGDEDRHNLARLMGVYFPEPTEEK